MENDRLGRIYESFARPALFRLDPEAVHHGTVRACQVAGAVPGLTRLAGKLFDFSANELQIEVAGIPFPNPIGLAAGWDKNGLALRMLDQLGFGFVEIGSVSASRSLGNLKPRLFRVPSAQAIIVNYGLPNDGAAKIASRLKHNIPKVPRGVNLVTTNRGPTAAPSSPDEIFEDYATSVSLVQGHASYLTLNLSCPNANDGKDFFAQPNHIHELLSRLASGSITVPIFLKLPPVDSPKEHDRWLCEVDEFDFVKGFVFNLAPGKPAWLHLGIDTTGMPGAVAGAPVRQHHNRCIERLYSRMNRKRYTIIGGGGVFNADHAWEKIQLGASLVQIYTALIYHGPSVTRRMNEGLLEKMRQFGFRNLAEAVGSKHD
ncbi:quinone-dependent dihydroorotate dehydrogenase [Neorhodopirellula pilleata]|uniref:Dihydroorotate dehydrogenase (quinone) n=1 Tax=Neorhodopirellula pilleata TaxID=2714738 RepID=A0A5C6AYQ9_9BACT|nr:quinone-dependent dihydroorotate dehydrogenase [Neorhodopirellula pilleata]TWU04126.1 Dihydroorotate dehydrogenase (quinone) [Neorhodopirellula pilleata]